MSYTDFPTEYHNLPEFVQRMLAEGKIEDVSYRNDVCPSFRSVLDPTVQLFVQPIERHFRETADSERFFVNRYDGEYNYIGTPLKTEDEAEAERFMLEPFDQCTATGDGHRCELSRGHDGPHMSFSENHTWD